MSAKWMQYEEIWLPPSLQEDGTDRAVTALTHYFGRTEDGKFRFTGGAWDSFDPSGTRATSANMFTADDVLSCTLLSTPIGAPAALELMNPVGEKRFSVLLTQVRADRDFVDEASRDSESFRPAVDLFNELMQLSGVGMTRATKLLARKRPRLVPIVDSVILSNVFHGNRKQWQPLLTTFQANERALWKRLQKLHTEAGLSPEVSTLRVFDVLSWMEGAGYVDRIVAGEEIVPPDDGTQEDPPVNAV